jgi:dolichol-phosphate mannosyltransferase
VGQGEAIPDRRAETAMNATGLKSSSAPPLTLLSVVIPALDEEEALPATVQHLNLEFKLNQIPHEIVVVDDGSQDRTWAVLQELKKTIPELRTLQNSGEHGFGRAVVLGLRQIQGDAVVIMMADESDDARDAVRYWKLLNEGWDCVFGSRFTKGGGVIDYPKAKLYVNRLANLFIRVLFRIPFNDTTNAFKAYRRNVIQGCEPLISPHFNLTVEIPLKAMVRGYSWIKEMGSRYFFICTYVWLEKYFSRGDYQKHLTER